MVVRCQLIWHQSDRFLRDQRLSNRQPAAQAAVRLSGAEGAKLTDLLGANIATP